MQPKELQPFIPAIDPGCAGCGKDIFTDIKTPLDVLGLKSVTSLWGGELVCCSSECAKHVTDILKRNTATEKYQTLEKQAHEIQIKLRAILHEDVFVRDQ